MIKNQLDILIMSDNCLDTVGGEQESTKIIINGSKDNFKLGIIQPGVVGDPQCGVKYFNLTKRTRIKHLIKRPVEFIRYIYKVKEIINTNKPKIIHTQAQVSLFIVSLLMKLKLVTKESYIIHTERGLYTKYNIIFKQLFYFFFKEINMLVTTTQFNMKYWEMALRKKNMNIHYKIIENTAGEIFETYDETIEKNIKDNIVIGFAGRFTEWKNWPLAIEISEKLNVILKDKLHVKMAIGCLDEKALQETKFMFSKLRETFNNRFDGKININISEMDKFYYDIDVFILTSNYNTESFGRTLVEAMSRKNIVLTTDSGGSVEVVGNIKNVCTSADEFIEKILEYYNDNIKMYSEKDSNLIRVREVYSLKNNLNKHSEMYSSIINAN